MLCSLWNQVSLVPCLFLLVYYWLLLFLSRKSSKEILFHSSGQAHYSCRCLAKRWTTKNPSIMLPHEESVQYWDQAPCLLWVLLALTVGLQMHPGLPWKKQPLLTYTGATPDISLIPVQCPYPHSHHGVNTASVSLVFFLNSIILSNAWPTNFSKPKCPVILKGGLSKERSQT